MKQNDILYWLKRLAAPALTAVLGVILICNPDSASSLIVRILGWVLVLAGTACGISAMMLHPQNRTVRFVAAGVLAVVGLWLLADPMVFTKFVGRVLGLFLMVQGGRDISLNLASNGGKLEFTRGMILAIATAVIGLVLLLLPLTTSRLLFTVIGAVMIGLGVSELLDRLKGRPQLEAGGDPDIIDVEKL